MNAAKHSLAIGTNGLTANLDSPRRRRRDYPSPRTTGSMGIRDTHTCAETHREARQGIPESWVVIVGLYAQTAFQVPVGNYVRLVSKPFRRCRFPAYQPKACFRLMTTDWSSQVSRTRGSVQQIESLTLICRSPLFRLLGMIDRMRAKNAGEPVHLYLNGTQANEN